MQLKGGHAKQRRHPGMISSQDNATAHYGAVTSLKATEDGMYLLSAGSYTLCSRPDFVIAFSSYISLQDNASYNEENLTADL